MTRQDVPPLITLSGAVLEAQWDRVGHITLSDRCRRPVGREKKKKPPCLIFGTRTIVPWHDQPTLHSQHRPHHEQAPPAPLCRGTSRAEHMREQRMKDKTERKRRKTAKQHARYTKRMTSSARKEQAHIVRTSS